MTKLEQFTEEFNNIDLIKIFEIEVVNKTTKETDYIVFDISVDGEQLIAQHEPLTEEEHKSPKIAFKSVEIDPDFSLDQHLQDLLEECTTAIIDSEYFDLKEE